MSHKHTVCQVGVFAAYVSTRGHALIDRQLYLPKDWTGDPKRLAAAHVPEDVKFATKPHMAVDMVERAIGAGVPFAWVAADSVYGVGEVEMALRRAGKGYVLGVASRSTPGASRCPARPRRSRSPCRRRAGSGCPPAPEPRGHGFTTGPIWNWPTSTRGVSSGAARRRRPGHAAC